MVEETAEEMEVVLETSVDVKRVRLASEIVGDEEGGGGLRSRMDTLALRERRRVAVARPRPDEPPEMMKVLFSIFILLCRIDQSCPA